MEIETDPLVNAQHVKPIIIHHTKEYLSDLQHTQTSITKLLEKLESLDPRSDEFKKASGNIRQVMKALNHLSKGREDSINKADDALYIKYDISHARSNMQQLANMENSCLYYN